MVRRSTGSSSSSSPDDSPLTTIISSSVVSRYVERFMSIGTRIGGSPPRCASSWMRAWSAARSLPTHPQQIGRSARNGSGSGSAPRCCCTRKTPCGGHVRAGRLAPRRTPRRTRRCTPARHAACCSKGRHTQRDTAATTCVDSVNTRPVCRRPRGCRDARNASRRRRRRSRCTGTSATHAAIEERHRTDGQVKGRNKCGSGSRRSTRRSFSLTPVRGRGPHGPRPRLEGVVSEQIPNRQLHLAGRCLDVLHDLRHARTAPTRCCSAGRRSWRGSER